MSLDKEEKMDWVGGELKTRNEQKEMERWEMPEERYEGWQVEGRCAPRWEDGKTHLDGHRLFRMGDRQAQEPPGGQSSKAVGQSHQTDTTQHPVPLHSTRLDGLDWWVDGWEGWRAGGLEARGQMSVTERGGGDQFVASIIAPAKAKPTPLSKPANTTMRVQGGEASTAPMVRTGMPAIIEDTTHLAQPKC